MFLIPQWFSHIVNSWKSYYRSWFLNFWTVPAPIARIQFNDLTSAVNVPVLEVKPSRMNSQDTRSIDSPQFVDNLDLEKLSAPMLEFQVRVDNRLRERTRAYGKGPRAFVAIDQCSRTHLRSCFCKLFLRGRVVGPTSSPGCHFCYNHGYEFVQPGFTGF